MAPPHLPLLLLPPAGPQPSPAPSPLGCPSPRPGTAHRTSLCPALEGRGDVCVPQGDVGRGRRHAALIPRQSQRPKERAARGHSGGPGAATTAPPGWLQGPATSNKGTFPQWPSLARLSRPPSTHTPASECPYTAGRPQTSRLPQTSPRLRGLTSRVALPGPSPGPAAHPAVGKTASAWHPVFSVCHVYAKLLLMLFLFCAKVI